MTTKEKDLVLQIYKNAPLRELPPPIKRQQVVAKMEQTLVDRAVERRAMTSHKPGPVARVEYKKGAIFSADTESEIVSMNAAAAKVVGTKTRGNKRLGSPLLYSDLVQQFQVLKKLKITLPKGGSLSLRACQHGLIEILRLHGCLKETHTDQALKSSKVRAEVGHKMARIFDDICRAI
jgi:hypothetical protein